MSHKITFNSLSPTSQNPWEFSLQACPIAEQTKHWTSICPTKFWFKILHLTFSLPTAPFKYQTLTLNMLCSSEDFQPAYSTSTVKEHSDWEKATSPFPSIHITRNTPKEILTRQKPTRLPQASKRPRFLWYSSTKLSLHCCSSVHWLVFFSSKKRIMMNLQLILSPSSRIKSLTYDMRLALFW